MRVTPSFPLSRFFWKNIRCAMSRHIQIYPDTVRPLQSLHTQWDPYCLHRQRAPPPASATAACAAAAFSAALTCLRSALHLPAVHQKPRTAFLREHAGLRHSFAASDIGRAEGREVSHRQVSVYTQSKCRISIRIYPDISRHDPLCFYAILSFLPSLPG